MKKNLKLAFLTAFCLVVTACGKKEQMTQTTKPETKTTKAVNELNYGITSSPEGKFNPLFANTQYDTNVNKLVYDSLLKLNSKIELEPSMAEKYEISEDGKKVVFTLRDGLKFHDGKPVTSKDVKFTLSALASPDYEGDLQSYVQSIVGFKEIQMGTENNLKGVVCPNDKTVEINFETPYSPVLINIGTLGILPSHIWENIEIKKWSEGNDFITKPIGSGPYKLEEFKIGEFAKLVSNEDYFNGAPKLKTFTFKVIKEETVSAELLNGSIDLVDLSSVKSDEEKTLKDGGVEVKKYPNSKMQYMGFNLRDERLKDVNLRTAFAYGIDRESIVKGLLEGNGVVINTPMVPTLWSYPKTDLIEYKFDESKAKEYLKKAGYEDTNGNGVVDKDAKDLELTLTVPTGDTVREKTATVIQENLSKIGVKINLEMLEFKATMGKVVGNHEFELYLMGNTLDADPDPTPNWYSTQASDEKGVFGWNIAGFKSEEADKLMDENRKATKQEERAKILNEFGKLLNKELPWIPLYASDIVKVYNKGLKNYEPNTFVDFYNVEKWELEK
ncbi:MAG: ABC transporter substrate-binding protein [Peptoniphilaceae bacterium]|uniref:ABC transporter substrate-binding protein n=1 Tax=Parvimonas sp. TaxID=1944660 RepID=UPI0025D11B6F|nr:ABC transporter substrate-binding protein [Parvimonas sp.]MCI5997814.1 ABC transporter substrate-binding protein [Parvimonas sp.]MDD7765352.1 ABC transporter substrate-binding protein [Peptoniphilaceae bacterium]MDY3050190.1 ABC transporter substrate-binding protein [Parvimonas sp.]